MVGFSHPWFPIVVLYAKGVILSTPTCANMWTVIGLNRNRKSELKTKAAPCWPASVRRFLPLFANPFPNHSLPNFLDLPTWSLLRSRLSLIYLGSKSASNFIRFNLVSNIVDQYGCNCCNNVVIQTNSKILCFIEKSCIYAYTSAPILSHLA